METGLNGKNLSSICHKKKYWVLLRNVLRAIALFKIHEAKETSVNDIVKDIQRIPTDQDYRVLKSRTLEHSAFRLALKDIRREQIFSSCVNRGNMEDLNQIKIELFNDPYQLIQASHHPFALINKRNKDGLTPLYVACRNGNFEVVKCLLEQKADFLIDSLVENETESNLEVAVRWGHSNIVFELAKYKWPKKTLKRARELTKDPSIILALRDPEKKKKKNSGWCFCGSSKN